MTCHAQGNKGACDFDAGVLEFSGRLRAFVRARINNPQDAEDLTQDILLRVFKSRAELRDPSRLEPWIYQAARNTIVDFYRRRRPGEELPANLTADEHSFDDVARILRNSSLRFLQTLPDIYRIPLELSDLQGLSIAEIADRLKLGLSATKSRLQRGRALLRDKLMGCCQFEFDSRGTIIDYRQRTPCACPAACIPELDYRLGTEQDAAAITALLSQATLVTADLTPRSFLTFTLALSAGRLVACAGIEVHEDLGLLRSVAVSPELRNSGLGTGMLQRAEHLATQLHLSKLFLLTTTAPAFFARNGYIRINRDEAPAALRASREFSSLCPASAVVMHKSLV